MGIAADMDAAFADAGKPRKGKWLMGEGAIRALAGDFDKSVGAALGPKGYAEYHGLPIEITDDFKGWELRL